ncbi:hypothetical protein CBR_g12906 [Chara braunii]|uniref:Uncharacterized protein n=1 Tax=Chara braunii TaxID=69332 RepID=A0A388KT60_CHABU|nr:hypothetical protein CBR_g12906 [Chara braunii]|eukprot:GBG73188.1 hypothetical protein CBR_g12906 [Chara braunii]
MARVKVIRDSGRFPHVFQMLGFSDLAVLARSWDIGEEVFQTELNELAARLEVSKIEYSRECIELPEKVAAMKRTFLRAWGLSDSHVRAPTIPRARREPAVAAQPRHAVGLQALEIGEEERQEMEQVIAAINATTAERITPPRRVRRYTAAEPTGQFTAFAPLASERWVEHTCLAYRHGIWKIDTFNHLSPMSIKALQFIAGVTDEEALTCQEVALDGSLEHAGKQSKSIEPADLSFPPMSYLDRDKCGDTPSVCWQKGIKQPPNLQLRSLRKEPRVEPITTGEMVRLPIGRKKWVRERVERTMCLHMRYSSHIMKAFSIRKLVKEMLERVVGEDAKNWQDDVMFGWTYNDAIAAKLCRPYDVFKDFDLDYWLSNYKEEECHCNAGRNAQFRNNNTLLLKPDAACPHVITLDTAITSNNTLRAIMGRGLNHIPIKAMDINEALTEVDALLDRLFEKHKEIADLHDWRDRSTSDSVRVRITGKGKMFPSWTHPGTAAEDGSIMFDEDDIVWVSEWCLTNNWVRMGAYAWRQVLGIPIGLACSPIWCDLYFFKYEFAAIMGMVSRQQFELVQCFRDTFRYVDDVVALNNTIIAECMQGRVQGEGVTGGVQPIYPVQFIEVVENTMVIDGEQGRIANFLNMTIFVNSEEEGTFSTTKHDKNVGLGFQPIRFMRYKSNRSVAQSLQIITAQTALILVLYTDPLDVADELFKAVSIMANNEFDEGRCWAVVKKVLAHPERYKPGRTPSGRVKEAIKIRFGVN